MAEHTPTPWTVDKVHFSGECHLHGPNGEEFALLYVSDGADDPEPYPAEANAAFIVKAVNNHDALVEALEDLISDAERQMKNPSHHQPFSLQKARDALARVGDAPKP